MGREDEVYDRLPSTSTNTKAVTKEPRDLISSNLGLFFLSLAGLNKGDPNAKVVSTSMGQRQLCTLFIVISISMAPCNLI